MPVNAVNDVRPFRALHYDHEKIADIGSCLAQPYDVISPQQQEVYYRQHPHNVIRLILSKEQSGDNESENPYTRAKNTLEQWRKEGMIRGTERTSFWVYEQAFDIPEIGRKKVKGFIGLVRLQDYEEKKILAHERIMSRPLEDRVRLMQATETQFEYIWSIYQDKAYVIDNILDEAYDLLGWVEGVHRRLRDIGNLCTQYRFAHVIGIHSCDTASTNDDLSARIVERRKVIPHQAERQRRLATAGFSRDSQGFSRFDRERDVVDRVDALSKAGDILCC